MRTLGRIIGIISMLCIMVGGSALDSASVLPMVIAGHVVKMSEARGAYAALEGMKKDEQVQKPSVYGPSGIRRPRLA